MRPALFRLLKRPSALSILDSLVTSPFGIEQLGSKSHSKCLRCHSQNARQANTVHDLEQPAREVLSTRKPQSFRVYEIQSHSDKTKLSNDSAVDPRLETSSLNLKRLALQPEKLDFESDVGHTYDIGSRLVDDPIYRADFALWEELLRYRQRRYGYNGTFDIWEGLMTRVAGLQLPVEGARADFFWQSFIELGFKRETIMNEVANYALELWSKTGKRWNKLHQCVVTGFIERGMTRQAVDWHKRLQTPHLSDPNDIIHFLKPAIALSSGLRNAPNLLIPKGRSPSPGLFAFRGICKSTTGHRLYGPTISHLVENHEYAEMYRMHNFLIGRGDHPTTYDELRPLIEHARECGPYNLYEKLHRYAMNRFPAQATAFGSCKVSKTGHAAESGGETWLEERPFKDEFGARVFATKALNFDVILSGLKMFGVTAIGPQSLREMASRARGGHDITERLRQLEKEGISIGGSLFARLLRKLAAENREILLSDFLRSDQHPEALEDGRLQESLLVSYYVARDWRQYNLTLAILGELHGEGSELPNIHFRKYIAAGELVLASKVVDEMVLRGGLLTKESIDFMIEHVLRLRKPGAGPPREAGGKLSPKEEVTFVCRILQRIVPLGAYISPRLWVEMIKRLGITDNWDELRTCCIWLSRHYSPTSPRIGTPWRIGLSSEKTRHARHTLSRSGSDQMLQSIFSRQMQAAIVAWGFKIQPPSKLKTYGQARDRDEGLVPYVRGLVLLRELGQNGVTLYPKWIHGACNQRLAVLFGRPRYSNRRINRELRQYNPFSLERVIDAANRVWGGSTPLLGAEGSKNDFDQTSSQFRVHS